MDSIKKRVNQTATAPVLPAVMELALVACSGNQGSDRLEITVMVDGWVSLKYSGKKEKLELPEQLQALDRAGRIACSFAEWHGKYAAMKGEGWAQASVFDASIGQDQTVIQEASRPEHSRSNSLTFTGASRPFHLEGEVVVCETESGCAVQVNGPADKLLQAQYVTDLANLAEKQLDSDGEIIFMRKLTQQEVAVERERTKVAVNSWELSNDILECSNSEEIFY